MIGRLNHVAIAVPNLKEASDFYKDTLGATVSEPQDLADHGVTIVFVSLPNTKIELMTPFGSESPITNFLNRHPNGGIHHLCYEVKNIDEAIKHLQTQGMRVLGKPKIGAHGTLVIFLHPGDAYGTLIELEEVGSN